MSFNRNMTKLQSILRHSSKKRRLVALARRTALREVLQECSPLPPMQVHCIQYMALATQSGQRDPIA